MFGTCNGGTTVCQPLDAEQLWRRCWNVRRNRSGRAGLLAVLAARDTRFIRPHLLLDKENVVGEALDLLLIVCPRQDGNESTSELLDEVPLPGFRTRVAPLTAALRRVLPFGMSWVLGILHVFRKLVALVIVENIEDQNRKWLCCTALLLLDKDVAPEGLVGLRASLFPAPRKKVGIATDCLAIRER